MRPMLSWSETRPFVGVATNNASLPPTRTLGWTVSQTCQWFCCASSCLCPSTFAMSIWSALHIALFLSLVADTSSQSLLESALLFSLESLYVRVCPSPCISKRPARFHPSTLSVSLFLPSSYQSAPPLSLSNTRAPGSRVH